MFFWKLTQSDKLFEKVAKLITTPNLTEQQAAEEMKKINKWRKFEYQDIRELRATRNLQYLWNFGSFGSSFEENPIVGFSAPGYYVVTLNVARPGCFNGLTKIVEVAPLTECFALFESEQLFSPELEVQFTDLAVGTGGDSITLISKGTEVGVTGGVLTATVTNVSVAGTFLEALDIASAGDGTTNGIVTWFQYGGDTYLVQDNSGSATNDIATDVVVKITGTVDLLADTNLAITFV